MDVERKIVTILFADLVGFTSLSERLDAEDVATIQGEYFKAVRETLRRYGGVTEKFIGDAAMAVFGVPRSRDDDAERAVRAGLALINALTQVTAKLGLDEGDLQLRVGVNTGETVVHPEAQTGEMLVTGDTVNVAARLQTAAPPGGIMISETTSLTVADSIEFGDVISLELKGRSQPVLARIALGVRPHRSRDLALGRLRAPIRGRDDEIQQLFEALDGSKRGGARRTLIVAPPGVTFSSLVVNVRQKRPVHSSR